MEKNIDEFAFPVDGIRNPLAAILGYSELFLDESLQNKIRKQVFRIDAIISRFDELWIESDRLRRLWRGLVIEVTQLQGLLLTNVNSRIESLRVHASP